MRIAIITREFPPDSSWGGMSTFYSNFVCALTDLGHHCEVFQQSDHNLVEQRSEYLIVNKICPKRRIFSSYSMNGPSNKCFSIFCKSLAKQFARIFHTRNRINPFDVIEVHDHMGLGAYIQSYNTPLHNTVHTPLTFLLKEFPNTINNIYNNGIDRIKNLEQKSFDRASTIRFLSRDMHKILLPLFNFDKSDICFAYNPCYIPINISYRAYYKKNITILYFGRLEERKGVHLLPEIFHKIWVKDPEIQLIFAGQDTLFKGKSMTEYLKDHFGDMIKNVSFLGFLNKDELYKVIQDARYVIVPSLYDNSAFAAQESMAHGRCVICSKYGGTKEYIGENGIIIDPINAAESATKIFESISSDSSLRLGKMARKFAKEYFCMHKYVEDYLNRI